MTRRARVAAAWLCAAWLALLPASAFSAGRYDARLRFRSIRTAHFTIYYHQGEEAAAARLAALVEPVRSDLERRLALAAPTHTRIVLVDQDDVANGWSTPFPYDLIELAASPPAAQSFLGQHDDWLRLVFTHEYTHTMHLDQVGGVMRLPRWLLGRHPVSFPNLFAPTWEIEGIATFAEGLGGFGRTHAADVAAAMQAQRGAGRAPHLDQLAGGLVTWPAGWGPYFYGGSFIEHLARQRGDAAIGELARRTSRRLPYFSGGAFAPVFGDSASALWNAFAAPAPSVAAASPSRATRLSNGGYLTSSPRFDESASGPSVIYATNTPHAFPSLRRVSTDGRHDREMTSRFPGNTVGVSRGWLIYDELEYRGPVSLVSDLYAFEDASGRRVRLSSGARLGSPDVTRDGSRIAATQSVGAERALVVYALALPEHGTPALGRAPEYRLRLDGCSFDTPRWSPDGRLVAATLACLGSLPDIVLIDPSSDTWFPVAESVASRDITPAWTPDGRWLLFASDRGGPFAIYAAPPRRDMTASDVRLVWSGPGGATAPDVSADGTTLAFVGTTAGGTDVFVAPLGAPTTWPGEAPAAQPVRGSQTPREAPRLPESQGYSPWATLVPRYWEPVITADSDHVNIGARTGSTDALGRHAYSAGVVFAARRPATTVGLPEASRADWDLYYAYDRWWPTFFASAAGTTDRVSISIAGSSAFLAADSRSLEFFGGMYVPVRRLRNSQGFLLGISTNDQRVDLGTHEIHRTRNAARVAWSFASSRRYGYSVSPEHGVRLGLTAEQTLPALGADGRATTWTADARAYLPGGFPHAVFAVRGVLGSSTGHRASRRVFAAGGPDTPASMLTFDHAALGLLRGISDDDLAGTAIAGASADYRFPLWRIERGRGAWPLFLNTLHGAVFADVVRTGAALDGLDRRAWSTGAEISADVTLGFGLRMTATAGAAWTHDAGRLSDPGRAAFFVRTGYAF